MTFSYSFLPWAEYICPSQLGLLWHKNCLPTLPKYLKNGIANFITRTEEGEQVFIASFLSAFITLSCDKFSFCGGGPKVFFLVYEKTVRVFYAKEKRMIWLGQSIWDSIRSPMTGSIVHETNDSAKAVLAPTMSRYGLAGVELNSLLMNR